MKNHFIYACVALTLIAYNCKKSNTEKVVSSTSIQAVKMPSILASGNSFPIDSTELNSWIENSLIVNNLETNGDIITHGWDIWTALTDRTNQQYNGQTLRRFETWYTPEDIKTALRNQSSNSNYKLEDLGRANQGFLEIPNQNLHDPEVNGSDVVGFVKYDPTAANHIYNNELYYFEVLKAMIKKGEISNIPPFPSPSIAIKPVFYPLTNIDSLKPGKYSLPAWPGYQNQISMDSVIAGGFGPNKWNNNITITTTGETDAANKVFSINDFIHFKLDEKQATQIINVIDNGKAKAGDYAVLVGMHVNTRENRRWTWQTFWWSENPDTPQSPSSKLIADLRPKSLDRAAKHYAMGVAYNMISPTQPYAKGTNAVTTGEPIKQSIYAYNPYLEAGFSAAVFDDTPSPATEKTRQNSGGNDTIRKYYSEGYQKIGAKLTKKGYRGGKLNRVGIETNCMSCHGQARIYNVSRKEDAFQYYITDQYFDLNAPYFNNTIVLDFVWSIQGNLIDKEKEDKVNKY
ncbi:MAG: hypothetical protein MK076_10855 [Flavobacteriales bacterium]|nr:hypothetical protein [Flavobacteriales bacterium]